MIKSVGYVRVSTEEQVKNGSGLDIQEKEIKDYCKRNKVQLIKIYSDEGISGANDTTKRKGLNDLLQYCKKNKVDNMLITKMDRLARDVYIQLWFEKELLLYNVKILSINEDNLNGDDYMTKAMRQMVGVFAELEKNRIADRLLSGRRNKAAEKKQKASGNCPFGYKYIYNDQGKTPVVVIDPTKAEIVKEMYSLCLKGKSVQYISNLLNKKELTTERGNTWSKQAVYVVLTNNFYTGIVRFNDIIVSGQHEAVINKITFGKVKAALKKRRKVF